MVEEHLKPFVSRHPTLLVSLLLIISGLCTVQAQDCTADNDPPIITCSDYTLINPFPNSFFGLTRNDGYTYEDVNEAGNAISYSLPISFTGHRYPPGLTEVTLLARDSCSNEETCIFYVNNPLTELPVNCPELSETVILGTGQSTYVYQSSFGEDDVTFAPGVAVYQYIGDEGVTVAETLDGNVVTGAVELGPGTHVINHAIADEVLSKSCTSFLIVQDNEPPTLICPSDITSQTSNVNVPDATVTDNADETPQVAFEPLGSGDEFPLGLTTITVTASDSSSNTASCTFIVTVEDVQPPNLVCPGDVTSQTTVVNFPDATVTDNFDSSPVVTYQSLGSGDEFPLGLTTITVTASDSSSNTASCTFTVTVEVNSSSSGSSSEEDSSSQETD